MSGGLPVVLVLEDMDEDDGSGAVGAYAVAVPEVQVPHAHHRVVSRRQQRARRAAHLGQPARATT